ncbi:4'-phosphopantetheinyl transferase family protein [Streptomyces sp. NPDC058623]|uniref:4'-phosphopantetheinyl transferase family protein n=1 Tax=Streptomyces sp. NPDC058623 TaxID=3346563 RepID=UPI00365A792C
MTTARRAVGRPGNGANSPAPVDIWWWLTTESAHPEDASLLTATELAAAARLPRDRRGDAIGGRAAVRRILGRLLEVPPGQIEFGRRPCPGCTEDGHGPPYVRHPGTDLWISISHTRGCGLLAVADHPVGVDVEHQRRTRSADVAPKAMTPAENAYLRAIPEPEARNGAFLRCWTRKEATLKAVGIGIITDLSSLETLPADPGPVVIRTTVPGAPTRWETSDLPLPTPYVGSVAHASPSASPSPELLLHPYRHPH